MSSNPTSLQLRFDTKGRRSAGFTMVELMVAVAVFLIVGAAAMTLFKQHAQLFTDQQNQVGLNVSLRNALSQMETDIVNAGTGYYQNLDISSWPVGLTVKNSIGGAACHTPGTQVYTAACFDTLTIVAPNPTSLPGQPAALTRTDAAGTGKITLTPPVGVTPTTLAAGFTNGSQILFMHNAANGTNTTQMTTAILNAAPVVNPTTITLSFNKTNADGTNGPGGVDAVSANDPLGLTTNVDAGLIPATLTNQFVPGTDWVMELSAVTYSVDATNPLDPQLKRGPDVIADQIIGFKVGASTVINAGAAVLGNTPTYSYNAANKPTDSPAGYQNQFDQIRSVRISIIGRTPPNQISLNGFTNTFDGGAYKIQAISIVVNPRNLSMNDK